MKKSITLIAMVLLPNIINAQPVLNYSPTHSIGTVGNVFVIGGSHPSLSQTGANINWDLSGLSLTEFGTFGMISPSQSPYESQYPLANLAFNQNLQNEQSYAMCLDTPTELQVLAADLGATSPNIYVEGSYDKLIEYPFNFNESFVHTRQEVGELPETYTRTYDAYGTLTINGNTWNNIVRISKTGSNSLWFTTSPVLYPIIIQNSSTLFIYNEPSTFTKLGEIEKNDVLLYPNPAVNDFVIHADNLEGSQVIISDVTGKIVTNEIAIGDKLFIDSNKLSSGIYAVSILKNGSISNKKIQIAK